MKHSIQVGGDRLTEHTDMGALDFSTDPTGTVYCEYLFNDVDPSTPASVQSHQWTHDELTRLEALMADRRGVDLDYLPGQVLDLLNRHQTTHSYLTEAQRDLVASLCNILGYQLLINERLVNDRRRMIQWINNAVDRAVHYTMINSGCNDGKREFLSAMGIDYESHPDCGDLAPARDYRVPVTITVWAPNISATSAAEADEYVQGRARNSYWLEVEDPNGDRFTVYDYTVHPSLSPEEQEG